MNKWIIFLCFVAILFRITIQTCSYENCPKYKPDMLNVHLICHTHDDVGWLKTADQYFWGTNRSISKATVNYILNSVFSELMHDPRKKFTYAETSFFSQWWHTQHDVTKHQFKKLVNQGQIEFIGGGWVQHDEATTHYAAIIDQMTLGHRFLNVTFGKCGVPKVAWQIDPFGHSRESASLFALMNLEALFFARIHYVDRAKRWEEKSMEMIWHGSDDIGPKSDILTSVLYSHYMPPDGFCFDEFCDDDPIIDDTRTESYNLRQKVDDFIAAVLKQSESYATKHIMLTMGGDFHYSNANAWFTNLDKLITYVNERQSNGSKVNVFYSTPTCYARALTDSGVKFPEKFDDFFPYANDKHSYWTGYFTSRPTFKGYVRSVSNLFQVCQSLDAIAQLDPMDWGDVDVLHRAMGVMQHHDAVSGTAKQHVTNDYAKILYEGVQECQQVANDAMKYLSSPSGHSPPYHSLCTLLNETVCNVSQTATSFLVTVHNGLSKEYRTVIRIPVNYDSYRVLDPEGQEVEVQVDTVSEKNQLRYVVDRARYELIFPVNLLAFGYGTYYVEKSSKQSVISKIIHSRKTSRRRPVKAHVPRNFEIENEFLIVTFDPNTGLINGVTDKRSNTTTLLSQNFFWYRGASEKASDKQPSGAYIFRPNGTKPHRIDESNNISLQKIKGSLVQEMRQVFSDWVTQSVRLISRKPYIEFEWTVGPIPHNDNVSREIISKFDTNIQSNGLFYTDSNGRQMIVRKRNNAPTYNYSSSEPIASNYYPVNTRIAIMDKSIQMTILTDRTQGGSSLVDGSVELMVHRRLLQDDHFGVEEALNETGVDGRGLVATGKHWLLLEKPSAASRKHRFFAMEMFYQPLITFAPFDQSFDQYREEFKTAFSGLTAPLPQNLHILTVAQWKGTSMLLRLEHIFQHDEDHEYSRPVTLSLKGLFSTFDLETLDEVTLSASEYLPKLDQNNFTITLNPMDIRTFRCEVKDKRPQCFTNRVPDCVA